MGEIILVTGGAGFIGSNVALELALLGRRVVVCDWLEVGEKWRNISDIDLFDIIAPPQLPAFLNLHRGRVEAIIHMGAISATTERDGDRLVENNIRLSIDLWDYCCRHDTALIYASSAAVYGDGTQGFDDAENVKALARLRPLNAYGWSKLAVDRRFARDVAEGAPTPSHWAGLRFFNVYGPREEHKGSMRSVISQIMPRVLAGERIQLFRSHRPDYHDGGQLRDFVFVSDCVAVILWLLENRQVSGIFNLGTGKARSFNDLALAVYAALGQKPAIEFIDTPQAIRTKYQYFTEARMTRLQAAGYKKSFTTLEEGAGAYAREWIARYGEGSGAAD